MFILVLVNMIRCSRLIPIEVGTQKCILLNLLTGAVDIITDEEKRAFWEGMESQPLYEYMEKRGHVFHTTEAEEDFLSRLLDKLQIIPQRLLFSFIPTYDSNCSNSPLFFGRRGSPPNNWPTTSEYSLPTCKLWLSII